MEIACPACNMPFSPPQVRELNHGLWPHGGPCPHCGTALVPARPPLLKSYAGVLLEISLPVLGVLREEFMLSKNIYFLGFFFGIGGIVLMHQGHQTRHFYVAHPPAPAEPPLLTGKP